MNDERHAETRPANPVLAQVVRSGFVEGIHRGALVLLAPDGSVRYAAGDVSTPIYPRSSNKPMQAAAALRAGAPLHGELLASAAASHSGEPFHAAAARTILGHAGLDEEALRCPPDLPMDEETRQQHLRSGGAPERLLMNCSGKHAGMLAACVAAGWPVENYLDPGHPLQLAIREEVADAAGEEIAHSGVDGCGAPVLALSLTGLARAFRGFVCAEPGDTRRRVADAMRAHPAHVAGTRRWDTWMMRDLPGSLSKIGAEAVQAVAFPDGGALALKIDDGGKRAIGPVLAEMLRHRGVDAAVRDQFTDQGVLARLPAGA